MTNPKISVIMAVFNGEKYLRESIESILNQTYHNFEFIIINDGSTDKSVEIINSYEDSRIRLIHNSENLKLARSLNKGIDLSKGEYIARMDADDVALPQRLERQVSFMDTNPNVGICGSWIETFGNTKKEIWKYPLKSEEILVSLIFESVIAHPSVIIRKQVLNDNKTKYNITIVEDYDLWIRLSKYTKLANIGEVLLYYRIHSQSIGQKYHDEQYDTATSLKEKLIKENLGIAQTIDEKRIHESISCYQFSSKKEFVIKAADWLNKLIEANKTKKAYPEDVFLKIIAVKWYLVLLNATQENGLWTFRKQWLLPIPMKTRPKGMMLQLFIKGIRKDKM